MHAIGHSVALAATAMSSAERQLEKPDCSRRGRGDGASGWAWAAARTCQRCVQGATARHSRGRPRGATRLAVPEKACALLGRDRVVIGPVAICAWGQGGARMRGASCRGHGAAGAACVSGAGQPARPPRAARMPTAPGRLASNSERACSLVGEHSCRSQRTHAAHLTNTHPRGLLPPASLPAAAAGAGAPCRC